MTIERKIQYAQWAMESQAEKIGRLRTEILQAVSRLHSEILAESSRAEGEIDRLQGEAEFVRRVQEVVNFSASKLKHLLARDAREISEAQATAASLPLMQEIAALTARQEAK
jgi:CRISPR/Cas system-associated exonuclease Cas4 (RecB family)